MSLLSKVPPIGQERQREMLKSAVSLTYLETDQGPVQCHFFVPQGITPAEKRPVVIFFHGGFWDAPMPTQFVPHCLHFASRGAVAIAAETRVQSIHGSGPVEALADVEFLLSWLRGNAVDFGIDLDKVVLGGASGGAFLALSHVLPKPAKDAAPEVRPRGLILFSSLLDATAAPVAARFPDKGAAKALSPLRRVRRGLPPMVLFHGKNDRVTPYQDAQKLARALKWRRNRVELVDFDNAEHSFFNFNVSETHYELTLRAADRFLVDLGILPADANAVV